MIIYAVANNIIIVIIMMIIIMIVIIKIIITTIIIIRVLSLKPFLNTCILKQYKNLNTPYLYNTNL